MQIRNANEDDGLQARPVKDYWAELSEAEKERIRQELKKPIENVELKHDYHKWISEYHKK